MTTAHDIAPQEPISEAAEMHPAIAASYERQRRRIQSDMADRVWRATQVRTARQRALVLEMCSRDARVFFNDWLWTYDPRLSAIFEDLPTTIPFSLRPRQADFLVWLAERERTQTSGLVEKSRDEGVSYLMCGYLLHRWLFREGFAGAMGSRKQELVDKIGDPKSLFWKVRQLLYSLPDWFLPEGFDRRQHDHFLRLVNPASGATITGEAGDEMGRGGRATLYYVDEWAHTPRAESVNAAISQNSNVRIKVFTANGTGNVAYQERFSGKFPVFRFHWRDNPDKNFTATRINERGEEEAYHPWYEKQVEENDPVTLAQEVDIDYHSSAENTVIPAAWVRAALGLKLRPGDTNTSGLDVSEDGADKTMYANRRGGVVTRLKELRGTPAQKAAAAEEEALRDEVQRLNYDRLGVGSAVTATLKAKEADLPFKVVGLANSERPTSRVFEDNPKVMASERFADSAAEMWWALRLRFWRTWRRVQDVEQYPDDECISLPADQLELVAQLSQPTYAKNSKDKIKVDKRGGGTASPDRAEAVMYAFAPEPPVQPRVSRTIAL